MEKINRGVQTQLYAEEMKEYYPKMFAIGVPVLIQNLIGMSLNLLDTLMIGKLGEKELAAVGAANQVYFIFTVLLFGLFSGMAVFTAQYFGARDRAGVHRMVGICYMMGFLSAIVVTTGTSILAEPIISLFSKDAEVIAYGASYLRIANKTYPFAALSFAISYNSRAIQQLKGPTTVNAIAIAINAVFNLLLIFGLAGFPRLGVEGAAIATLIARVLELIMMLSIVYIKKDHYLRASFKELFDFDFDMYKKVMKTALPVVLSEGSWAVTTSMTFAAFGKLGTSALAVSQIANVVCDLLQSVFFGVGNASAMMIGEKLGQKKPEVAYIFGKRTIRVVWVLILIMTAIMAAVAKPIAMIYGFDEPTNTLLIKSLLMMSLTILPKMLGYIYICGIFRAGGDTVFCMIVELIATWCFQVPMAFFAVLVLKVDLPMAFLLVEVSDLFRIAINIPHFRKKKWMNIVT
ncbi:MAG: MATE family efflux transporter [Clostridia bacterium]|nr:MATE family efflux transporter [Clostridia bacterium]